MKKRAPRSVGFTPPPRDPLEVLADVRSQRLALLEQLAGLDRVQAGTVAAARQAGQTWAAIGATLGVTAQALHKRYGVR